MNKKLFLVLFLALILVVGLVYAKNISQTEEKKASTTVLSKEDAKAVKTAPQVMEEAVPEVRVEKVVRPAFPGLQLLDESERAAWTAEPTLMPAEAELATEAFMPLDRCFVRNDTGAYYFPTAPPYNSPRKFATFIDPEYKVLTGQTCAQPTYPFRVDSVYTQIWLPDSAHFTANAFILAADFSDPYCPYPGDTIAVGPTYTINTVGAFIGWWMDVGANACVYDRFFAAVNMRDRPTNIGPPNCQTNFMSGVPCDSAWAYKYWEYYVPETRDCFPGAGADTCIYDIRPPEVTGTGLPDTIFGHTDTVLVADSVNLFIGAGAVCDSVLYDPIVYTKYYTNRVMYSPLEDSRGQACKGYMYMAAYGVWYDLVTDFGRSGFQRIRVVGQTANTNTCPPDTFWYQKPATDIADYPEKYAPCGVPDFSQYDHNYPNNGAAYCGPTAVANCFWWAANFWPVTSFRNYWGGWTPAGPPILIQDLATYFHTDPVAGTDINALQAGLDQLILDKAFFISEVTKAKPDWYYLQYQLRLSQDVILLLGFYQEVSPGVWNRIGGHYVTMAGVNKGQMLIKLSDPAVDVAEMPGAGWVCSNGMFIPHAYPPSHPLDFLRHDDAGNTSHDVHFAVSPSPSPGGVVALPDYPKTVAEQFVGKNGGPNGTYNPQLPVMTEIEYAVVICPISALLTGYIFSWDFMMAKSNFGGEGVGDANGWVWWTSPYAPRNDLWEGGVIVGTNPNDLAVAVRLVGAPNYQPLSYYNLFDPITWTNVYPTVDGDTAWSEYYSTNNTDLKVHMRAFGFYDTLNLGMKDGVIQEFTITNTGAAPIADVEWALIMDFDPGTNTAPLGVGDSLLNTGGIYETSTPKHIDYMTLVPTNGQTVPTFVCGEQNTWLYDDIPLGPYTMLDSVMNMGHWDVPAGPPPVFDYALLMVSDKVTLGAGESAVQTYFMWADSTNITAAPGALAANLAQRKLFLMLKWIGFFRGDVDCNGKLALADVVYLANYLLKPGSPVPKPFADQGDCDGAHAGVQPALADVIYLANYIIKPGSPAPIDFPRWPLRNFPQQQSLFISAPQFIP